jgi:hypothetical protein
MAEIEIWHDGKQRRMARFDADVEPTDAGACTALLRSRAREMGWPVARMHLRVWAPKTRRWIEYRA